jgi:alpha-mannosidase
MKTSAKAHILFHTHWDREWFLTQEYTNRLLKPLFDNLFAVLEHHWDYHYVLDGQVKMVHDYLEGLNEEERAAASEKLARYAKTGQLFFGPYYTQVDWLIPGPEALVRNLTIGIEYAEQFGNCLKTGWIPDSFGLSGQVPQIHRLCGIDFLFFWRGIAFPNDTLSTDYLWQSPDGSMVHGSWFLRSPRNLYRSDAIPNTFFMRVASEIKKITPFSVTDNYLLLDGYDQETETVYPFDRNSPSEDFSCFPSNPHIFKDHLYESTATVPLLSGEMLSGRYVSVFPCKLSANIYLKLLNYQLETLLFSKLEPIDTFLWRMTGVTYQESIKALIEELLTLLPHDNISGVCADPVHIRMEEQYLVLLKRAEELLRTIVSKLGGFFEKDHLYAINTNTFPVTQTQRIEGRYYSVRIPPLSIQVLDEPVKETDTVKNKSIAEWRWDNPYYTLFLNRDGTLSVSDKQTGMTYTDMCMVCDEAEVGDEYSHEPIKDGPFITSKGSPAETILNESYAERAKLTVTKKMEVPAFLDETLQKRSKEKTELTFSIEISVDQTPFIGISVRLKNLARDHRCFIAFPLRLRGQIIRAGMPFETVERAEFCDNSKPLPNEWKELFRDSREISREFAFPMGDFVSITNAEDGLTVLTKGLCEYEYRNDMLLITLVRAANYQSRGALSTRSGGAGPAIYTPYAQCIREMVYNLGLIVGKHREETFYEMVSAFHNPPIIVEIVESSGSLTRWSLSKTKYPAVFKTTAVKVAENRDGIIYRGYNASSCPLRVGLTEEQPVNLREREIPCKEEYLTVVPMQIVTLKSPMNPDSASASAASIRFRELQISNPTVWKAAACDIIHEIYLNRAREIIDRTQATIDRLDDLSEEQDALITYERMWAKANAEVVLLENELSLLYARKMTAGKDAIREIEEAISRVNEKIWEPRCLRRYLMYIIPLFREEKRKTSHDGSD